MLNNPDFDGQFDYTPYIQYDKDGQRQWKNFMSGNYAWRKSVRPWYYSLYAIVNFAGLF